MLNDLPAFLAIRIEEKFKNSYYPFAKIWRYKDRDTVFDGFKINDLYFKMDIWCNETQYDVYLWNPNDESFDIAAYFKEIKLLSDFKVYNGLINNIVKHYDVFDDEALFDFITSLLKALSDFKDSRI